MLRVVAFRFFLFFFLCFGLNSHGQNADINLLKYINLNRNTCLDPSVRFVTNSVKPVSVAVPLSILGAGLIQDNKELKSKGLEMCVATGASFAVSYILKYSVNHPRPYVTYPVLDNVTTAADPSFPSGHTSMAFATATTLSLNFPKWYVIVPAYLWAGSAGYSRLHLGMHYPSDVLVGAVIGSGSAFLTHKANQWLQRRKVRRSHY